MAAVLRHVTLFSIWLLSAAAVVGGVLSASGRWDAWAADGVTPGGASLFLTGLIGAQVVWYLKAVERRLGELEAGGRRAGSDPDPR